MSSLPNYYFVPAKYFFLIQEATSQYQLKGNILIEVKDKSVPQHLLQNALTSLESQWQKDSKYRGYVVNLQGKIRYFGFSTEPDLAIINPHQTGLSPFFEKFNPVVIIEVLSPDYDRERKFQEYHQIASLQEYVRIDRERYVIEHLVRQPGNEWKVLQIENWGDNVYLASIEVYLFLAAVFK